MRKGDDRTTFIVLKVMKNPKTLTLRIPRGQFRSVAGKLYLLCELFCSGVKTLEYETATSINSGNQLHSDAVSDRIRTETY